MHKKSCPIVSLKKHVMSLFLILDAWLVDVSELRGLFALEIRIGRGPRVARALTPLPIHAGKRCFSVERVNASKKRPPKSPSSLRRGERGLKQAAGIINYIDVPWQCFFFFFKRFSGTNPAGRRLMQIGPLLTSGRATWRIVAHLERSNRYDTPEVYDSFDA